MTTLQYQQASEHFLGQARQELADGDLPQASEKGWGAAALMLKAIAEQRGWEHGKHRHLSRVASRLRAETGDRDIYRQFSVANDLHGNFYEDEMASGGHSRLLGRRRAVPGQVGTVLPTNLAAAGAMAPGSRPATAAGSPNFVKRLLRYSKRFTYPPLCEPFSVSIAASKAIRTRNLERIAWIAI